MRVIENFPRVALDPADRQRFGVAAEWVNQKSCRKDRNKARYDQFSQEKHGGKIIVNVKLALELPHPKRFVRGGVERIARLLHIVRDTTVPQSKPPQNATCQHTNNEEITQYAVPELNMIQMKQGADGRTRAQSFDSTPAHGQWK